MHFDITLFTNLHHDFRRVRFVGIDITSVPSGNILKDAKPVKWVAESGPIT